MAGNGAPPAAQPLSADQQDFISAPLDSSQLLIAAAGSGKTTCLIGKFEACLRTCQLGARIDIISFSNSAAATLQKRFDANRQSVETHRPLADAGIRIARTLHSWAKNELLLAHSVREERVSFLLPAAIAWFSESPVSLTRAFARGRILLVDEAQDCCKVQLTLLELLHNNGARVVLVGDPRQSIYSFMGAVPRNMMALRWQTFRLVQNYRSSAPIVELANLIATRTTESCPQTGLEQEALFAQEANKQGGRLPTLQFVSSLQYYHLRQAINEVLQIPRSSPACILARSNAEVDRVHQSISLLGYKSFAIFSEDARPASQPDASPAAPSDTNRHDVVHVRTIHSCKGEEYDVVILLSQGYGSVHEAREAFEVLPLIDKQEHLRLCYVACTRAKRIFHALVVGARPSVWWSIIADKAEKSGALRTSGPIPAESAIKRVIEEARADARPIHVKELTTRFHALDSLLTHLQRASFALRREEPNSSVRGHFANTCVMLRCEGADPPSHLLLTLHAVEFYDVILRFYFLFFLARSLVLEKLKEGELLLCLLPLLPSHLRDLERMVAVDEDLVDDMLPHLVELFKGWDKIDRVLDRLRVLMAPCQQRLSGTFEGNPAFALVNGSVFRDLVQPRADHPFFMAAPKSSAAEHIIVRLRALQSRRALSGASPTRAAEAFRAQHQMFDCNAFEPCRAELLESVRDFQAGSVTARSLASVALLTELARPSAGEKTKLTRILPYLSARGNNGALVLSLRSACCGSDSALERCKTLADRVLPVLRAWHSEEQLQNAKPWFTSVISEAFLPRSIKTECDLFVPGAPPTVFFAVCSNLLTIEDETTMIAAGALASGGDDSDYRLLLLELRTSMVYIYNMARDEQPLRAATEFWRNRKLSPPTDDFCENC